MDHKCKQCGRPMEQREYESKNRFLSRKYCSQECSKAFMKENKVGWFSSGKKKKKKEVKDNLDYTWMIKEEIIYEEY